MARYSGDGSYKKLIITIYAKEEIEESLSNSRPYGGLRSNPLSLNYTGNYGYSTGNPASRSSQARYRQSRSSISSAPTLAFAGTTLHVDYPNYKGYGFSVRRVAKLATDSICHKGWEMARYNENRSYQRLIFEAYSNKSVYALDKSNSSNGIIILPISLVYSGEYADERGTPDRRKSYGNYRGASIIEHYKNERSLELLISATHLSVTNWTRGMGYSVRRVAKLFLDVRNSLFYCKML